MNPIMLELIAAAEGAGVRFEPNPRRPGQLQLMGWKDNPDLFRAVFGTFVDLICDNQAEILEFVLERERSAAVAEAERLIASPWG